MIFVSGYSDETVVHQGLVEAGAVFVQKPFTIAALTRPVRDVLDAPAAPDPCATPPQSALPAS